MDVDLPYRVVSVADLSGHDDRAWHVAWNPAKPLLATCSADKSVRIYAYTPDPSPNFVLHTSIPTGHTKTVRGIAWSPSGHTLATASFDANIGIWQREDQDDAGEAVGGEWECVTILEGHETECKSVAWSPTGTFLASCSRDKTVWVWEAQPDADFECMGVLMEHTQDVKCVAWHPREEILASASYDDSIKLYLDDPSEDWFCFTTLTGHASTVWSLAWAPNGQYLASASDDRTVRIWKRITEHEWKCVLVLEEHGRTVYSVTWGVGKPGKTDSGSESLGWLASTGGDGRINVWAFEESPEATNKRPPKSRLIARLENAHGVNDVNSIAWCPRKGYEDLIATVGDDGVAKVWKVASV
ncbi:WD40 repeat-like protein [Lactarius akahatsu]|uniref:Probable cytosolic iron-sulfur protein assembly protein 1 n=1 Tax=Lactarius akahatsu TaxID=416441 RepID=A0AAD4QGT7_9AGAM|nr:WD40 repeat-like protein [Lactarius akahatsu]